MKIFLIVLLSAILFIVIRVLMIVAFKFMDKILTEEKDVDLKFSIWISISFLLIYLAIFLSVTKIFSVDNKFDNLEWYVVFISIGVSSTLWCYFKWELRVIELPKFNNDKYEVAIKKAIVFLVIMILSFYYGYMQVEKIISGKEFDIALSITNLTIVPGVISLDRVLNQMPELLKSSYCCLKK